MAPSVGNEQKAMSKSTEGNSKASQSHTRRSFPTTPKKPGRAPSSMSKFPPPPPQHTIDVNREDSTPGDNTPITNAQYTKLMAQYQTMVENWAQQTESRKKQPRQKSSSRSNDPTRSSSQKNKSPASSIKRRNETSQKDRDQKRDLAQVIQEVQELKKIQKTSDSDPEIDNNPLSLEIRSAVIPPSHRVPKEKYSGATDPADHVACFESILDLYGTSDAIKCRMFPATLIGMARSWYGSLPSQSISRFRQLRELFVGQFLANKREAKTLASLYSMTQGPSESLRSYIKRFTTAYVEVGEPNESCAIEAFRAGVSSEHIHYALYGSTLLGMHALIAKAQELANVEEVRAGRVRRPHEQEPRSQNYQEPRRQNYDKTSRTEHNRQPNVQKPTRQVYRRFETYTPLNTELEQILNAIAHQPYVKQPNPIQPGVHADLSKYCAFHKNKGHMTNECTKLKDEVEFLIGKGHLKEFIRDYHKEGRNDVRQSGSKSDGKRPIMGVIHTIVGSTEEWATSSKKRRAHLRSINTIGSTSERHQKEDWQINFSSLDADIIKDNGNDPIAVSAVINNFLVERILVDDGSAVEILMYEAFKQMGLDESLLRPTGPVYGFANQPIGVKGLITLPVTLGQGENKVTIPADFLVVDLPSAYNAIIGRPLMKQTSMVTAVYCLTVKFPTPTGVGYIKANQATARQCHLQSLQLSQQIAGTLGTDLSGDVLAIEQLSDPIIPLEELDPREDYLKPEPVEQTQDVRLGQGEDRVTKVGSLLHPHQKTELENFLIENSDVFAWSAAEMPGISPSVIFHSLNINPNARPIRQKRRRFAPERVLAIQEETDKLLKAGFIREAQYPDWLSNVVMVKKANGKWRMCVDFTDLNKACPKDSFPLPSIDRLVDATAGHKILSFMDAFSGYNQIVMNPADQEKTAFITEEGLYCYQVMPFGLKNAGATYQRLVNRIFKNKIGKTMEVYVDDMLVKSPTMEQHLRDLEETFSDLRRYKMKLNPDKCAFGVEAGKFLGFMVSHRGIEANPEKVQAILTMPSPTSVKDIQKLTGKVAALHRFVSRAADKCLPFFKILRNAARFTWNEHCDNAFLALKQYLISPPQLVSPTPGETLYLYLAASDETLAAVLIKEDSRKQLPVYYVSKALHLSELNYSKVEKLAFALVMASRKLRQYFQSHHIVVFTDQPIKDILQKMSSSGRMVKWSVELSEYSLEFRPRRAIKAQVLADFVAECSFQERATPTSVTEQAMVLYDPTLVHRSINHWSIYVDGSSTHENGGVGVLLLGPDHQEFQYSLRFMFPTTNNAAEYEALLAGLRLANRVKAERITIYTDSQLVTRQVSGEYEIRDPSLKKYYDLVQQLWAGFESAQIIQIPREYNSRADNLSRLHTNNSADTTGILVEYLDQPSIRKEPAILTIDPPDWRSPIITYLENPILSVDPSIARIRIKAARYTLLEGTLYKKSFTLPYLRCLGPNEAEYVLKEIHEGICGQHLGGRSLYHKAIRQGYYWPHMKKDAMAYVQKCHKCQEFARTEHSPPENLTHIISPWPFAQWGLDILGPFPIAKAQKKFVIVACEYFTKWPEAEAVATITQRSIEKFLWENIICRFGIPHRIIVDNGPQLKGDHLRQFCENLHITLSPTSVAHPQSNGQTEATNKNILNSIKKRLDDAKGLWVEELPSTLWALRTTIHSGTRDTPFNLAFGMDAVIPVEIGINSIRVSYFNPENNESHIRLHLDLLEEVREEASLRAAARQKQTAQRYNKTVKPKSFNEGDLVLRNCQASRPAGELKKLSPSWEGPYLVSAVVGHGAYKLQHIEGVEIPRTWNAQHLKKYYC